jgi:NAD(P)-dependent dehydrogenase (short-subunit alcohol dehydrogenase family)
MLETRLAVVTGGAKGLGRAAALRLAEDGRDIALWDLLEAESQEVQQSIQALGRRARVYPVDVADRQAVAAAGQATLDDFGRVDILVNAAGIIGRDASVLTTPLEEWDRVLAVNLTGTYLCSRVLVDHMARRGWGRIVNFTSSARRGVPALVPYAASKAGVVAVTSSFAREFTARGVLVMAVEPGRVTTDMVLSRVPREVVEHPSVPIGRYADPAEIAEVVAFLCSERNTYLSGGVVPVHGGG